MHGSHQLVDARVKVVVAIERGARRDRPLPEPDLDSPHQLRNRHDPIEVAIPVTLRLRGRFPRRADSDRDD
jgi:hypothetical protein